jgi:hypothetical protein
MPGAGPKLMSTHGMPGQAWPGQRGRDSASGPQWLTQAAACQRHGCTGDMRGQAGISQRLRTPRGQTAVDVWACTSQATSGRGPPASPPGWRTIAANVLPALLVPAGAAGRAGLCISAGGKTAAWGQGERLLCYVREVWPGFSEDVSSPAQGFQVIGHLKNFALWA